jgi:hypothetical protein
LQKRSAGQQAPVGIVQPVSQQAPLQQAWCGPQCERHVSERESQRSQGSQSASCGRHRPLWQTPQSPPHAAPSATGAHQPLVWPAAIWQVWHGWQSSSEEHERWRRRFAREFSLLPIAGPACANQGAKHGTTRHAAREGERQFIEINGVHEQASIGW